MNKDNGGPAFPVREDYCEPQGHYLQYASDGMSLRDYFAAKAMAACIIDMNAHLGVSYAVNNENLAMASYAIADAMLVERAK